MTRVITGPLRVPSVYRFAGVEVWLAQRIISRNGGSVYLRPRTFDLLVYLLAHRDEVVTKEVIATAVWEDSAVTDNSLVQCVKEIRKALGDDPRHPTLIRTIPKVGYQFIAPCDEIDSLPAAAPPPPPAAAPSRRRRAAVCAALLLSALAGAMLWISRAPLLPRRPTRPEAAWWTFDDPNLLGHSLTGHRGQIAGAVLPAAGMRTRAARFASPGAYIHGEAASGWPAGDAPRSVAAWIQALPNGDHSTIFQYGARGPKPVASSFAVWLTEDGRLAAGNKWAGGEAVGRTPILDGSWHFVAAAYEGPAAHRVRLYLDGSEDGAGILSSPAATGSPAAWTIGRFLESGTSLRGSLDELRLYRRALSTAEVGALYRCLATPDAPFYPVPVWPERPLVALEGAGPNLRLRNPGTDFAGIQFAAQGDCALRSIRGADLGQDLEIRASLLCPRDPHGYLTQAGPYFRSRSALPGEGILGGASAGYWVMLHSNGAIKVLTMNPMGVAAFSNPPAVFDDTAWHDLRARALGNRLQVWLDGAAVTFDQDQSRSETVRLSSPWTAPPVHGDNQGAAGLSFACWDHRDCQGAQQARNLVFTKTIK